MLSERLKEETHTAHIKVEKLIVPRIKSLDSNYSYARLLAIFYGYFKPLEEKIESFIDGTLLPDMNERRKSATILEDIQVIGQLDETPFCNDLPAIESATGALGAMYVIEGSTLGGQFISKMISDKLDLADKKGVRFFTGYGTDTFVKWSLFKEFLNNFSGDYAVEDEVIEYANQTFTKFENWIELN